MTTIDEAVRDAATQAGMLDLDLLPVAAPFLGNVKINDAGKVEGADKAMAAFKKAKPSLFAPPVNVQNLSEADYATHRAELLRESRDTLQRRVEADNLARIAAKFERK